MSYKRIGATIRKLREECDTTQEELAEAVGVSSRTIMRIENGQASTIKLETLKKIATFFDIHESFFIDMNFDVSRENLTLVAPKSDVSPPNLKPQNDMIRIPLLHHINASAGSGAINELPKEIEHRGFTKEILRESFGVVGDYQNLFIIHSFGNSMHPTIPQNALLLVQKGIPLEGQICVARIGEEMFVKRIAKYPKIELLSDNDKYKPISITEDMDFEIIGRVVGYFGRL